MFTIRQRFTALKKIEKLTGIDFDNANEVLAVRIGLVVYKMIENYNKDFI